MNKWISDFCCLQKKYRIKKHFTRREIVAHGCNHLVILIPMKQVRIYFKIYMLSNMVCTSVVKLQNSRYNVGKLLTCFLYSRYHRCVISNRGYYSYWALFLLSKLKMLTNSAATIQERLLLTVLQNWKSRVGKVFGKKKRMIFLN